jgi:hypothetical protein
VANTPADVYFSNSATSFTLLGNANIGALKLLATDASSASVTLGGAYTGAIDAVNLGYNGVIATVISNWENATVIKAITGYIPTASDIGKFTLGRFIGNSTANIRPITGNDLAVNTTWNNYCIKDTGDDIGKLVVAPIPVTGVTLSESTLQLTIGGAAGANTGTLVATVEPSTANQNVTWESSNTAVATVSDNGTVTALSIGTAVITVTTAGLKEDNTPATTSCLVSVTPSLTLSKTTLQLTVGGTETLTYTVNPAYVTLQNVSWESTATNIATVANDGTVTAVAIGTVTITVTTTGLMANNQSVTVSKTCIVNVQQERIFTISVTDAAPVIPGPTISRSGANDIPKTYTLSVDNPGQYTSIEWYISGIGISAIGSSITLNAANSAFNILGAYSVTVEVMKNNVPYNRTVTLTVVE